MTLAELQKKLKSAGLDAFLVARNNMFIGQDVLEEENQIRQLAGFSGSAGELLITPEKAYLFVDGRYELQAPAETDPAQVEVVCTARQSRNQWLSSRFNGPRKCTLGYNPWCWTIQDIEQLAAIPSLSLQADEKFLPAVLSPKPAQMFEHSIQFSGKSAAKKLAEISEYLQSNKLAAYLFTAADSVSWLCNLRSDALPETPILRAYALVDQNQKLWLFGENLTPLPHIEINPFAALPRILRKFKQQKVACSDSQTPAQIAHIIQAAGAEAVAFPDHIQTLKAVKNPLELDGIRNAHRRDAVAMCKFLYWLENHWQNQTELDLVAKLHGFRTAGENYHSESFGTIAAFGPNGAIVHYQPHPDTNRPLASGSVLLLDSGAQYYDGTTDITRTIAIGEPSTEIVNDFTLVLQAHIALNSAVFPAGTEASSIDAIARAPLWANGKDYAHGTGHGVGCFLNVHEGPFSISRRTNASRLAPGMITSIEPGYYKEGAYGIRIENLVEIIAAPEPELTGYLKFANLTLVPIDKRLVNKYLLSDGEINWLNTYHRQVYETVAPALTPDERSWLQEACSPL